MAVCFIVKYEGLGKRETFELARKGIEFMCAGDGIKQDSAAKKLNP